MPREMQKKQTSEEVASVRKFEPSDGILCRSVVQGGLVLRGAKTDMDYQWDGYGDETEVEYRDLVAAVRSKSKHLFNPWMVVEDEDFIAEFPVLKQFYENQWTTKELIEIFELPVDFMIEQIKSLPKTALDNIKVMAATKVANGSLDSVKKIRALDEYFGTDLNLIASLSDN